VIVEENKTLLKILKIFRKPGICFKPNITTLPSEAFAQNWASLTFRRELRFCEVNRGSLRALGSSNPVFIGVYKL